MNILPSLVRFRLFLVNLTCVKHALRVNSF